MNDKYNLVFRKKFGTKAKMTFSIYRSVFLSL